MATVTLSALLPSLKPPPCDGNSCPSATGAQKLFFFFGLYLIAFGSGGVKSSLLPLGAHQFDEENPAERVKQSSFFNWFYFCINVGALVSSTLIVWIQENVDWALGFAICALCIAAALGVFLIGTPTYRVRESRGSPLKRILQVLVASYRKANLNLPADSSCLYEVQGNNSHSRGDQRLERTRDLRFLDKAAILSDLDFKDGGTGNCSRWRLCTVTQVEESKLLLRLFPIWLTGVVYSAGYSQMYTTFVEQGRSMDKKIGSFSIPPASLCAFEVLSVMFWVVLYNTAIRNIVLSYSRGGHGLSELQRIGIGYVLMILAIATAAVVEAKRLEGAHDDDSGKPISILWQLPQFFIVGASEVFCCIAQLELFYDQGSDTMKSMSTAISLLAISLGNYLSSLIVTVVNLATTPGGRGWIPDDLDEGHLDYFFWLLVAVFVLNFVAYLACARRFTLRKTTN
ncbi:protein NRT1/ PTR FAMILY 8.3-like [Typha angustifolia]|uniref:protein NRT1/ PTR FAMILY 8.3-like n=1 Tax=Typha angustifolia TaxID=59011 RepID=UPI003C2F7401